MSKVSISTNTFINPMPIVVVGVKDRNKADFFTVGWVTRVNTTPPMIAVSISRSHYSAELIREHKAFSVNVPGPDLAEKVDYCGLVSGKDHDKSELFSVFFGKLRSVPMIKECQICLECKLSETLNLPTNYVFVGEIVAAYAENTCLSNDIPDVSMTKPLTLTMPDCAYRIPGEAVGKAWSDGKQLMKTV